MTALVFFQVWREPHRTLKHFMPQETSGEGWEKEAPAWKPNSVVGTRDGPCQRHGASRRALGLVMAHGATSDFGNVLCLVKVVHAFENSLRCGCQKAKLWVVTSIYGGSTRQ